MKIVKVQMPVDMERARNTGRMYIDHTQRPRVAVYAQNSKLQLVEDEALWERMVNQPVAIEYDGQESRGSMKTFFYAEYKDGKWTFGDIAPWQEW